MDPIGFLYSIPVFGLVFELIGYLIDIIPDISPFILRAGTPLALGALCGVLCERSGVVNIGIEGTMLASAFTGWAVGVAAVGIVGPGDPGAVFGITPALLIGLVAAILAGSRHLGPPRVAVHLGPGGPDHQRDDHQHRRIRCDRLPQHPHCHELARSVPGASRPSRLRRSSPTYRSSAGCSRCS